MYLDTNNLYGWAMMGNALNRKKMHLNLIKSL